jgi:methylmalonyl-CoA/ethylmalonyl-CoA epimerase
MNMGDAENGLSFHHVGYVVRSIQEAAAGFTGSLGLEWDGRVIHDPLQTVCVSFFHAPAAGTPAIELVEPEGTGSAVHHFLERGGGLHHVCFEVDSLDRQLERTKAQGDLIVRRPTPAVAFEGRRIAWVYTKNKLLVEYLEKGHR